MLPFCLLEPLRSDGDVNCAVIAGGNVEFPEPKAPSSSPVSSCISSAVLVELKLFGVDGFELLGLPL